MKRVKCGIVAQGQPRNNYSVGTTPKKNIFFSSQTTRVHDPPPPQDLMGSYLIRFFRQFFPLTKMNWIHFVKVLLNNESIRYILNY